MWLVRGIMRNVAGFARFFAPRDRKCVFPHLDYVIEAQQNRRLMEKITSCVILIVFLGTCGLTGCATLTRGNKQTIHLVTDPPAAKVVVDGQPYVSPADVVLRRNKKTHEVLVEKEGYQGVKFVLQAHWDAGGVGAVAFDAAVPGGSALFVFDTLYGADRSFNKMATIKLPRSTESSPKPVTLYEYKGKLLPKAEYEAAKERDKLFKSKKKKQAATQP